MPCEEQALKFEIPLVIVDRASYFRSSLRTDMENEILHIDHLTQALLAGLIFVIGVGLYGIQYWLRRILEEMRKGNELRLRFKKMELESARNGRGHE